MSPPDPRCTVCGLLREPWGGGKDAVPCFTCDTAEREAEVMEVHREFIGLKLTTWKDERPKKWLFRATQTDSSEESGTTLGTVKPKPYFKLYRALAQTFSESESSCYYHDCLNFTFDLIGGHSSAGQLRVAPLDMTLHKCCSVYLRGKKTQSAWFGPSLSHLSELQWE